MVDRLWDQLDIFKKHIRDYRFCGSNSLKATLPALVPALSYKLLDVQNGAQTQAIWEEMIGEEGKRPLTSNWRTNYWPTAIWTPWRWWKSIAY